MTDTPDLRTLAAEAIREHRGRFATADQIADAVLAAVLPAHRRQVLNEAAEVLAQDALCNEDTRYDSLAGAAVVVRRLASAVPETAPRPRQDDETAPAVGREAAQAQGAAEAVVPDEVESLPSFGRPVGRRRLMPAAAPDGPRTWQLPDEPGPEVTAVKDDSGDIWVRLITMPNGYHWSNGDKTRPWIMLVANRGPLTDATPADGQDGDGHG